MLTDPEYTGRLKSFSFYNVDMLTSHKNISCCLNYQENHLYVLGRYIPYQNEPCLIVEMDGAHWKTEHLLIKLIFSAYQFFLKRPNPAIFISNIRSFLSNNYLPFCNRFPLKLSTGKKTFTALVSSALLEYDTKHRKVYFLLYWAFKRLKLRAHYIPQMELGEILSCS